MDKLEKLLLEYVDKFDENFPTFLVMGMSDDEMIKHLEESIKTNKPYEPEIIEGAIY
jgi:hypothetical protein